MAENLKKIKNEARDISHLITQPIATTSIDCLPDDCLFLIFKHLTLPEHIRIERVCKKWMTISLKSWSSVKNVHVAQDFDHIKHPNSTHLKEILRRGGDYITYLRFNSYTNNLTGDEVIDAINKYCKQLENLEIHFFGEKEMNLERIDRHVAQNLKVLNFNHVYNIKNYSLASFLKKAINLEDLCLFSCYSVSDYGLLTLSDKCKKLNVHNCNLVNKKNMIQIFQTLPQLENLDVSYTKIFPQALIPISEHLVSLGLWDATEFFKDGSHKNLYMPKLKDLDVRWSSFLTDEIVSSFHKCFPSLTSLNLAKCDNLKFDVSCGLEKCKGLKKLDISDTNISDEAFIYLVRRLNSLKSLKCEYCDNLTELGLTAAVTSLPKLEWIVIGGDVSKLSEQFFKTALKSAKLRAHKAPLEISVFCEDGNDEEELGGRLKLKKVAEEGMSRPEQCVVLHIDDQWYVDSDYEE